jgi:phage tail-like protein
MSGQGRQPLETFNFVLRIPDIDTVGSFHLCQGLELSVEVMEYREGGNNDVVHRLPGRLTYPNLILSRGLTNEEILLRWFYATHQEAQRKEVTLTIGGGGMERTFTFADAFPVRWSGPTVDLNGTTVATESLEVAHAGLKVG